MTLDRIAEIKAIAREHPGHRSTGIINELVAAIEETNKLYCLAVDYGWSDHQSKHIAFRQLKALAEK